MYGVLETPDSIATAHHSDSRIASGSNIDEDLGDDMDDVWVIHDSPPESMEVDDTAQQDHQDESSFQQNVEEDYDTPVVVQASDEEEGDEGKEDDEIEEEEEDLAADKMAPEDHYSELKRLASLQGSPLSSRHH